MPNTFSSRLELLRREYLALVKRPNTQVTANNGIFRRCTFPILTAAHIPLEWRYDLNEKSNPYLQERIAFNAVFNAGAIKWKDKYVLVARVEGTDRKSFFAVAESPTGIDQFTFHEYPIRLPETGMPDTNVYDMRLIKHEDGWVYGLFCTERRDPAAPESDQSSALAQCGITRTKDLVNWERLPDLVTSSPQQRNVVLHPEFVNGKYALYTRPQDGFIETGSGGGISFGLTDTMTNAVIKNERIIDQKIYHTVYEAKNGLGPVPLKTDLGWLHLAHGVRNTAAGLRYVLYLFMTDLQNLTQVIYKPAGYFMAPEGEERIGDVSNVLFSNGWIQDEDGTVFIYYASSDTRMHVAVSSIDQLLQYVTQTAPDEFTSAASVRTVCQLIDQNKKKQLSRLENL